MKNMLLILLLFVTQIGFSQMKEGMIQYSIDVTALDTAMQAKQTAAMLRNSSMKIYFTQEQLRIEYKMGKINDMRMIIDYTRNASLSLVENQKGKFAILKKASDLEYPEQPQGNSTIKFYKDTKKVLGYTCKKAIITVKGVETTYWYTDDIKVNFKEQQFYDKRIPGFPMIFSSIQGGMKMSYQVSNLIELIENKQDIFL